MTPASNTPKKREFPSQGVPAERCPNVKNHVKREPGGYVNWHSWAEDKLKTHDQLQCPECGLWVIWKPKKPKVKA